MNLLVRFSEATGLHKRKIYYQLFRSAVEVGLFYVAGVTFTLSISFCLLTYYNSLQELNSVVHVMLGWSKSDMSYIIIFFYCALAVVLLPLALMWTMVNCPDLTLLAVFYCLRLPRHASNTCSCGFGTSFCGSITPTCRCNFRKTVAKRACTSSNSDNLCALLCGGFCWFNYMDVPVTMYSTISTKKIGLYIKIGSLLETVAQGNFFNGRPVRNYLIGIKTMNTIKASILPMSIK